MNQDWPTLPMLPEGQGSQPTGLRPSVPRPSQPLLSQPRLSQPRLSQPLVSGALRSRRQAEAAQQAQSELSVLTEQLLDLPERLQEAGLAREKARQMQEAMEAFVELAALAWAGMADGNFTEVAATPVYRQRAVAVTRRVSRLQQDAASATPLPEGDWSQPTPPRLGVETKTTHRPLLWRLRTRIAQEALFAWRQGLHSGDGNSFNVPTLGLALEDLRAAVGFTGMPTPWIVFWRALVFLAIFVGGLIAATTVGVAASGFVVGLGAPAGTLAVAAVALTAVWGYAVALLMTTRVSLRFVVGATRWRLVEAESHVSQGLLAGWHAIVGTLALLGSLGTIGYAGWRFAQTLQPGGALVNAPTLVDLLRRVLGEPLMILAGATGVVLALPILVALPALLIYQGMLAREMARGTPRPPQQRRVVLGSALPVLTFWTLVGLAGVLALARAIPALMQSFVVTQYGQISPVAPLAGGIVVALYLAAVGIPFAVGTRRWRLAKLNDLAAQRRDLSARLAALAPDPALADDVTTAQYDVARLQYLRLQEDDINRIAPTPERPAALVLAFVIIALVALLLDNGLAWALRTFTW
jgi:outer membrane murein-binding lipoprotein Lpp